MATPTETILVVRTVDPNGRSYGDFQWPLEAGAVCEAPDWDPAPKCGQGLHGLAWGDGDWSLLDWSIEAKALIVEVEAQSVVEIGGKIKFPRAVVREITTLASAICRIACDTARITKRVADWIEETMAATKGGEAGNAAHLASSGDAAQLASSGDDAHLASSGDDAHLASSGNAARLASSGYAAHLASSGDDATIAAAAKDCVAKAGPNGAIALAYHDGTRMRFSVGYVGEGLDADTWYRIDNAGQFVRATDDIA